MRDQPEGRPVLSCPACAKATLEPWKDSATGLEIDCCSECRGFWFDGEELSRLFPSQELFSRVFRLELDALTPEPGGERGCPRCLKALKLTRALEVEIDVCRHCRGIWLDAGELLLLVRSYPGRHEGDLMVLNQLASGLASAESQQAALRTLLEVLGQNE
ncbi:hypothetical protein DYH09_15055 [bacterium CPR1]|nr:hypothetical protein [bacterium CPR1]